MTQPQTVQITQRARQLAIEATEQLRGAQQLTITTAPQYSQAAEVLTAIKGLAKDLETERFSQTRPLDAEKKAILAAYDAPLHALAGAEGLLKRGMLNFRAQEDEKRRQAQREEDARAERERTRLETLAVKAEDRGDVAKADSFQQRAAMAQPAVIEGATPKAEGVSERMTWKFEITDAAALPREYLIPDEKAIRGVVNSLHERTSIPGVRVWGEPAIAAAARR